jgi:hypothetical protein
MGRLRHPLPRPSTNSGVLLGDGVNASTCQVAEAVGAANEEESIWKMRRHASGDLAETREPLYWYLNMRRAGTMGGPFPLRRLSGVGGEPGPLVFVGRVATQLDSCCSPVAPSSRSGQSLRRGRALQRAQMVQVFVPFKQRAMLTP